MRSVSRNPRSARAAVALLAGLVIGGWVGGGLVWILNRNKFKDPNTIADVALSKAEEVELATNFVSHRSSQETAWQELAQLLMETNEFIFID